MIKKREAIAFGFAVAAGATFGISFHNMVATELQSLPGCDPVPNGACERNITDQSDLDRDIALGSFIISLGSGAAGIRSIIRRTPTDGSHEDVL